MNPQQQQTPQYNLMIEMNQNLRTIRLILIFWNVLVILGLALWLLFLAVAANSAGF